MLIALDRDMWSASNMYPEREQHLHEDRGRIGFRMRLDRANDIPG